MYKILFPVLGFFALDNTVFANETDSSKSAERFTIHAQTTIINQNKPSFYAPYSGDNSLLTSKESQTSITSTLYAGVRLWKGASAYVNPELAGGSGLSQALGLGAATNGETFRIGDPAPKMYIARLYFQQVFALSQKTVQQESDFNTLQGAMPEKYLSVSVGKFGLSDFFDANSYSHDPREHFMSWALMNNGAWDYAANTRGYTPGVVLEYVTPRNEWRYGIALLPKVANGPDMNWKIGKSSAHNFEFTHHYQLAHRNGTFRLLAFYNTTYMGNYRQAINMGGVPDVDATQAYGRGKVGFGFNAEQSLTNNLGAFMRAGWNDGKNETWCFTEIDKTISLGIDENGSNWHRPNDDIGIAFVSCGLSKDHADYLKHGGKGFMLGDGKLNYAAEDEAELFYSAALMKKHLWLTGAYQWVLNPGFNKDRRGPVNVFSVRLHATI